MKIDDKFKEVKDFQQFRAKAGAVVFKVEAWTLEAEPLENGAAPQPCF